MRIEDLDTPVPIVDLDAVERNFNRAAAYFAKEKIPLRPHIKTHKIPEFARRQVALGACGVTCQKHCEAETMADGGGEDIMLTFPIWGADKLSRLERLARRVTTCAVTDSVEVAEGIASVGARVGTPFNTPSKRSSNAMSVARAAAYKQRTMPLRSPSASPACPVRALAA
jgi:D-serine deaminase-like pyridoxal phosphate-dependent protein